MSEATGVEIPTSLNYMSQNVAATTSFGKWFNSKKNFIILYISVGKEDYEEEEVEEEPAKFGRIQFSIDYNFDKKTLAVTVHKFTKILHSKLSAKQCFFR